jgi:methylglutaconyl-CoA hydratase
MSDELLIVRDGPVLRLTLNRPERRNALSRALVAALLEAFTGIDDEIRVVVLAGSGPVFCAGADLREYMEAVDPADAERLMSLLAAMRSCPAPVIGRIHGAAFGGGFGLLCATDIAVAAEGTRFSLSEARLGLVPSVIAEVVIAALGEREAKARMLLTDIYGADVSLRQGLVHQVVPEDQLDDVTEAAVKSVLMSPPGALALIKRLPELAKTGDRARMVQINGERRVSDEGREGMAAFLEKRRARWVPE